MSAPAVTYNFLPYAQDQQFLLPPSLHEALRLRAQGLSDRDIGRSLRRGS
jgi:hypothetical protein